MQRARLLLLAAACAFQAAGAGAREFPDKPVRIVIPYPISGPTDIRGTTRLTRTYKLIALNAAPPISDILAHIAAQAIGADTRHPVVLERQPGAVTTRGAAMVARAAADGHTLLLASNATMVLAPEYFHRIDYNPDRDFRPIASLATMPYVLMADSSLPVRGADGLVKWLKLRPGEINYGSSGDGSLGHLAGALMRHATGVDIVHVSFNGGLAALHGMAQGQVSFAFLALPLAMHYLTSRYFEPLGVASRRRLDALPHLPTLDESGLPGLEIESWFALFAPSRIPHGAASWLHGRIAARLADANMGDELRELGLEPAGTTQQELVQRMRSERARWGPVLRESRLQE